MTRVRIYTTAGRASAAVAREIAAALSREPSLVLGLPTGQTPTPLYDSLADLCRRGKADFTRARTFNLDELVGLGPSHPSSYRAFMNRHLFSRIDIPRRRTRVLDGLARNSRRECVRFERAIARAGGLDIVVLGLGRNGHVGFNEPGRALQAFTHRARLTPATRRANARWFGGSVRRVPREALTMGVGTILRARRIVLLAFGGAKAGVVQRLLEGPVTTRLPASLLQLHPKVDVVLDRAAAARLRRRATRRLSA
jgi:glucosamine-6-phosphate deaminase